MEYVSDRIRIKVGQSLNPEEGRDILNNKYLTYQALKSLYGRKIRQMNADGGYAAFENAFREKSVLVKKNNFQSLGKEIEKIETTEDTDLQALYERLSLNGRYFILEDLIIPHPELKRLNPDPVNTIRIVTYMNHEEALKTAKKAAQTIPEARYVGWDLVCTDENRWVIVEGNAMTMYIGQQAPLGIGKRRILLEKIHYDELN